MFRRRRKPRVVWLPVPGTLLNNQAGSTPLDPPTDNPGVIEFKFDLNMDQATTVNAPMVVDQPTQELLTGGASLAVYQAQALNQSAQWGYRLRRVVGDLFVSGFNANDQEANACGALIQCGVMVRQVDEATGLMVKDGNVGSIGNNADPWVWRRSFVLSALGDASRSASFGVLNAFPDSNTGYGTKWHTAIDQKTARRVGPEERLFFSITGWCIPLNRTQFGATVGPTPPAIYFILDYRCLASLQVNSGNRRNATR